MSCLAAINAEHFECNEGDVSLANSHTVEWNRLFKSPEVAPEAVAPPYSVTSTEWCWKRA